MRYIVIAGNTGVGKSTLVRLLSARLKHRFDRVVAIDERQFHHEFLDRMFAAPSSWALPVQVNFLIQRATRLMREAELADERTVIIMERHLAEDRLFYEYYRQLSAVPEAVESGYEQLWLLLNQRVKQPDLIVYMSAPATELVARLKEDMRRGERPGEPEGDRIQPYVEAMNRIYGSWLTSARSTHGSSLVEPRSGLRSEDLADEMANRVLELAR